MFAEPNGNMNNPQWVNNPLSPDIAMSRIGLFLGHSLKRGSDNHLEAYRPRDVRETELEYVQQVLKAEIERDCRVVCRGSIVLNVFDS